MLEDFQTVGKLVAQTHLTENQVRLALAYRDEYPDEIARAIRGESQAPDRTQDPLPVHPRCRFRRLVVVPTKVVDTKEPPFTVRG